MPHPTETVLIHRKSPARARRQRPGRARMPIFSRVVSRSRRYIAHRLPTNDDAA